ncbi:helix-hairpin-helix domain-containing protein [Pseudalkalibacillus decolorationis]|uniref:helix-hairpin-helix domain-containing protein n=1 Tax=Pseudalkalibacillus decolorationis TaxID=163879 RepID=UPI0021485111|nr:helix-hairpin-helix domain-containing protein [Pseudalkalibacillus decolorationis]
MKNISPKLPLTTEERTNLRKNKVKLREIAQMDLVQLSEILKTTYERAKYLRGLAQFQSVPSIGPKIAEHVVGLGFYSLDEIKNEEADLVNRFEQQKGFWTDPCVEDSFRCIVYYANHPDSDKSWFDFTSERKRYREQHGYPATRPATPWYIES